jgi:hypothetical protein
MNVIKILRYIALILGFQASVFFAIFLVTESVSNLFEGKISVIPILLMMIFSIAGFIYAVTRPLKGSFIMIAGGTVMAVYLLFMGGISEIMMALIFGLPFIIPGAIFYYISKRKPEVPAK